MEFYKVSVEVRDYDFSNDSTIIFTTTRELAEYLYDLTVDAFELTMVLGSDDIIVPLFNAHYYMCTSTSIFMTKFVMDSTDTNGKVCEYYSGSFINSTHDLGGFCPIASMYGSIDSLEEYIMTMDTLLNPGKYVWINEFLS